MTPSVRKHLPTFYRVEREEHSVSRLTVGYLIHIRKLKLYSI